MGTFCKALAAFCENSGSNRPLGQIRRVNNAFEHTPM